MATSADRQKAYKFLSQHRVAALSTVGPGGMPMSAIIYYVVDKNLNLFFLTKTNTAKYSNIGNNPAVSLAVYDEGDLTTVQIEGVASEVNQSSLIDKMFKSIVKHPGALPHWPPPIIKMFAGDCVILRVKPTRMRLADFRKNKLGKDESYFTPIVS